MYFNRDMWEKAGVPTPPETTDMNAGLDLGSVRRRLEEARPRSSTPSGDRQICIALSASEYGNGGPGSNYWYEGIYIRSQGDPKAPQDSTLVQDVRRRQPRRHDSDRVRRYA